MKLNTEKILSSSSKQMANEKEIETAFLRTMRRTLFIVFKLNRC